MQLLIIHKIIRTPSLLRKYFLFPPFPSTKNIHISKIKSSFGFVLVASLGEFQKIRCRFTLGLICRVQDIISLTIRSCSRLFVGVRFSYFSYESVKPFLGVLIEFFDTFFKSHSFHVAPRFKIKMVSNT